MKSMALVVKVGVVPCSNPSHRMALALTNRICKIPQIFGTLKRAPGRTLFYRRN
jgi:hypothetical protein